MKKTLIIASILVLTGCGGESSNSSSSNNQSSDNQKQSHGYYVDSSIIGADYVCGNLHGKTNNRGEFKFYQGDSCQFLIGDVKLREVKANELHDGITIYEHNLPVARVLQTLDKDGNPNKNGIEIASKSAECLQRDFNNSIPNSVSDNDIEKLYNCLKEDSIYNGKAVTQAEAQAHIDRNKPDTTPPTVTLNGKDKISLGAGETFTDQEATAIDDRDGDEAKVIRDVKVNAKQNDIKDAIFISPNGDDQNDGSYNAPLKDTKKICSKGSVIDKNIYFKEGVYNNFPMIQCSGTKDKIIEIKPWLNEKVKFTFDDATGIRLTGDYIKLSGIEVEGVAKKVKYKDALANWWRGDKYYNGSGIILSGHHVEVSDCVVHDATGSGISAKGWSNINIHNNVVYDCDWWTIAGSKGIGVTDVNAVGNEDNKTTVRIENNLIFGVESRIFSRVWGKGFAHLDLDEGEGILVQVNDGNYTGRYSIKNNFVLYTGKGIVANKTNRADILNNTLYMSGTTISGKFKGVRTSLTQDSIIKNNSVVIKGSGHSFNIGKSDIAKVTLTNNCGNGQESLNGVTIEQDIFANPVNLDFTPKNGCMGASSAVWNALKQKADEYGIKIKPTNWVPDFIDLTKGVIDSIPVGSTVNWSSWSDTEPFDLNITNIPNEGIKGRPNKFRLEVVYPYILDKEDLNLAYYFGKATQGTNDSYYYYEPASYAIDNNLSTFNHTSSKGSENWLQIKLPDNTKITKIVIIGRDSNVQRLKDTNVSISNSAYNGVVNPNEVVMTLEGTANAQVKSFTTPIVGKYVVLKAKDGQNLHVREVQVYGYLHNKPHFEKNSYSYGIAFNANVGDRVGKIKAITTTNSKITYEILDSDYFKIDANGVIKLAKTFDSNRVQKFNFWIKASDENGNSNEVKVTVNTLAKHGVKEERWNNISGSKVEDLLQSKHYLDKPDKINYLDSIDFNANKEDNFGSKFSTIFKVPKSGKYTFAIIGDDGTRLDFDNKEIAYKVSWGDYQDWNSASKSEALYLEEGTIHPITAYLKESGGAEHISVAYKTDSNDTWKVIPSHELYLNILTHDNVKPHSDNNITNYTISKTANTIGSELFTMQASDLQGDSLTYTIIGDVPFRIDENGMLYVNGSLEAKDYTFDIKVSDGVNETIRHITITSTENTEGINSAKEDFLTKARVFDENSSVDELTQSFTNYALENAKRIYSEYMDNSIDDNTINFINSNPDIKEGLVASRFPIDPYYIKNLSDFLTKWKEDGKNNAYIQTNKNVALGFSINARERGIFKEPIFGDTAEHRVTDYTKLKEFRDIEDTWRDELRFDNMGYDISFNDFKLYLKYKYKMTNSEIDDIGRATNRLRKANSDGYDITSMSYDDRKKYGLSYDNINVYRLVSGLQRSDCYADGNPCEKIESYINSENNTTLTKSYILAHFTEYKDKIGLINAGKRLPEELLGSLGVAPSEYRLMSFYDLAEWKIANNKIPAKDFNDNEPNWPLFDYNLEKLPWQILALEQGAQKQECKYIKSRFFETDKSVLRDTYPPNAIDGGKKAEKRFIQYTTYTWDYDRPEVWYRQSDWTPHRSYYRILQDGGVCGRQSTMGQHANECLNRPSIGTGQPGHRAWVGVFLNKDIAGQLQTNIGYKVGSRESATPKISHTIYNFYTSQIRKDGLEKFTGVVTGTTSKDNGEHIYNQSMILQHIGKILEDEGSDAQAVLKKAIEIMPQNTDAWYQLALYYAKQDQPEKVINLAKEYMQKRDNFFMEPDNRKYADNLELVTAKNIAFAVNFAPSIQNGEGDRAEWAKEQLWSYLDTYEEEKRSIRSYRNQNRFLAKYYLKKLDDESSFENEVEDLFSRFLKKGYSGNIKYYFDGVDFADSNKTELFDKLQNLTDSAQISDNLRSKIYSDILGREESASLESLTVNDVCIDSNLSNCQSLFTFELDAKAIYMIANNNHVTETTEVKPTERGKAGYSKLVISVNDDSGAEKDITVRMAKLYDGTINGKILKINDPTEVTTDKTKYVVWIDPSDNNFEDNRVYKALQRTIFTVKKRVQNNEETMGKFILNVKDLIKGKSLTMSSETFEKIYEPNPDTSYYFTVNDSSIGPIKDEGWYTEGTTKLSIKVVDDNGNEKSVILSANHQDKYKMGAGIVANQHDKLTIKYNPEDNTNIESGKHYKTLKPFVVNTRMWHKGGDIYDRLYISIDFTTP
ncbi:putative RTX toxin hemolysin-type calcium-binding protein [hydrothermal vent metagenome]|uniref:Putative RTX toxin hemolysin-type calcium-binding protein n=1 Tax=hydrothermal vent metagenome TaxID=652676 RepID=A0A1W1CX20_9ZZZZ